MPISQEVEEELHEYLGIKKKEREEGNTNADIKRMLGNFWNALNKHIEDDERRFNEIHKVLASHNVRLTNLEMVTSLKPVQTGKQSISPPAPTDTGSFKIPPEQWQAITSHVDELQRDKLIADTEKKTLADLNDKLSKRVNFVLAVATGVVVVVGALVGAATWAIAHIH